MTTQANLPNDCRRHNHGTLFNRDARQALRLGCNRWTCARCGPRKASRSRDRLQRVNWQKLITITMPPGRGWARRSNLSYQAAHLRSFWRAMTRRYGSFRYAWVREIGKPRPDCICHPTRREFEGAEAEALDCICGAGGSRLHLHILIDVPKWIPKAWMQATAKRCGFGFLDVRAIRGSIVDYVAKYLSKGWAMPFPPRTRRIQTRNVDKLEPKQGWAFTPYPLHLCVPIFFEGIYCNPALDFWLDSS